MQPPLLTLPLAGDRVAGPVGAELDDVTMRRAMRSDPSGARALVTMYQARVFALLSRMLAGRGRATVEDVAQDTFLHVFRQLASYDLAAPGRLSTWVLTIAARRAIDELRRKRPISTLDDELARAPAPTSDRADDAAIRRELREAIEAALGELTPELRAAFVLREFHDLDYVEIARALGIEVGTVKSRLSRARDSLRQHLAGIRHD